MVVAEVPCPVKIPMGFMVAARPWDMVEAPIVVVMLVGCTHQALVVITCLVVVTLVEAHILHSILVVAWVVVVIWEVVVLDLTIEI